MHSKRRIIITGYKLFRSFLGLWNRRGRMKKKKKKYLKEKAQQYFASQHAAGGL